MESARVEWCCPESSVESKAHDGGWELKSCHCRRDVGGQELSICSCTLQTSHPCAPKTVLTTAARSAMSSFTLLLLPIEPFLALSGKHSPGITSVVTPMANSHFAVARPPGQLAGVYIYRNGTPDETHQYLRRSLPSPPPRLPPVGLGYPVLSYPRIAMAPTVRYPAGASKLLCNEPEQRWWFEHWFKCYHSGNNLNLICHSQSSSLSSPFPIFCFCW